MKTLFAALVLSTATFPALAQKPCDELKSEIAAKLDAKGVKNYQLDIVKSEAIKDETVVGSCEIGSKKITYRKQAPAEARSPVKPPSLHTSHPR
jgi:hypothetical protein